MSIARRALFVLAACVASHAISMPGLAQQSALAPAPPASVTVHALLIANWDYAINVGRLRRPQSDAVEIHNALLRLGVSANRISVLSNSGLDEMRRAVRAFAERVGQEGSTAVGFVYFAGHGAAGIRGGDHLVPIDVRDAAAPDLWTRSYPMSDLIGTLSSVAPRSEFIVVIDACRSPLALDGVLASRRGFRGLAPYDLPQGVMLTYSTDPGQSASDDGRYARGLAEEIVVAGRAFAEVLFEVRERISRETAGGQLPWHLDKLRVPVSLSGANPDPRTDVRFELTSARRVIFVAAATRVYNSPNLSGGLQEIKSAGAVHHVADHGGRIYLVKDKGLLKWVSFQTDHGPAYALREQVLID